MDEMLILNDKSVKSKSSNAEVLTLDVVAGHKLQHLINADDREGELQDHHPLFEGQMGQLEDHLWARGERESVRNGSRKTKDERRKEAHVW